MDPILTVVFVYLLLLAGLAIWSRAESQSLEGYYLAGKKLPYWVVAFSTNATGESGWLLLGLTGMGYMVGAKAYWVVVGEVIGVALSWIYVSRRLKVKWSTRKR
jgi:Na+/proline symporter